MATETEIRDILRDPFAGGRVWTIQGLGMLRTYLDAEEVERLHIWDTDLAFPDVSTMHDHPWDFDSRVVSGHLHNESFMRLIRVEVQLRSSDESFALSVMPPLFCGNQESGEPQNQGLLQTLK